MRLRDGYHHFTASHRIWSEFRVSCWSLFRGNFRASVVISLLRIVFGVTLLFIIGVCCNISGSLSSFHHFASYLECLWCSLLEFVARLRDACHHFTASHRIWSEFSVCYWNLLRDFRILVVISLLCIVFGVNLEFLLYWSFVS